MRGKLCAPCPSDRALLVIVSPAGEAGTAGTRAMAPTEWVVSGEQ